MYFLDFTQDKDISLESTHINLFMLISSVKTFEYKAMSLLQI
jgi:hypothetical protein